MHQEIHETVNDKTKKNRYLVIAAATLTVGLVGALASSAFKTEPAEMSGSPTWSGGVSKIMKSECAGCHEWATDYDQVKPKVDDGTLTKQIKSRHNIRGKDRKTILSWINSGAPRG